MTEPIARSAHEQVIREIDCPRCGAKKKVNCHTPSNKSKIGPHAERCGLYVEKIGISEFEKRHHGTRLARNNRFVL